MCNQETWIWAPNDKFRGCQSSFEECRKCIWDASKTYMWLSWAQNKHCMGLTQEPSGRMPGQTTLCFLSGGKYIYSFS